MTATGTMGNFTLSMPSAALAAESASIKANIWSGDVATDAEMTAAIEAVAGEVCDV